MPAVGDYVALEHLEVGTVLRTYGGSEATVLGLTIRKGDVGVYDVEVEGLHNFFVRGPGSDAPGVLVHNSTSRNPIPDATHGPSPLGNAAEGDTVYRVFGGDAAGTGRSWTRTDPRTVNGYRDAAGLPGANSGRYILEGRLKTTDGVSTRAALPLDGRAGGLDEVYIPDPASMVERTGMSTLMDPL